VTLTNASQQPQNSSAKGDSGSRVGQLRHAQSREPMHKADK
jgi:hypothetical protein